MRQNELFATWSLLGTYALLVVVALWAGQVGTTANGVLHLLTGDLISTPVTHSVFYTMLATVLAVVMLKIPFSVIAIVIQHALLGKTKRHAVGEELRSMQDGNHFYQHFTAIILEEVYARWLFLGFLAQYAFFSNGFMFFMLFLVGNGTWALVHLGNMERRDWHILRVLPQFVGGIFYTYIFLQFGLVASILAHVMSNTVMFASHKKQRVDIIDILIVGYGLACVLVSYHFMDKAPHDALLWLSEDATFALPGWDFWDYLQLSVFVSGTLTVVLGLLLYDRGSAGKEVPLNPLTYLIIAVIATILMWTVYWLLGYVVDDTLYRILALAVLFAFLQTTASGSGMANVFWKGLPELFMSMCILLALGPIAAVGWLALDMLIWLPYAVLVSLDD